MRAHYTDGRNQEESEAEEQEATNYNEASSSNVGDHEEGRQLIGAN